MPICSDRLAGRSPAFRKILLTTGLVVGSAVSAVPAVAQVPKPDTQQSLPSNPKPALPASESTSPQVPQNGAPSAPRLALASVVVPGEKIEDGDFISSARYFGDWRLACDEITSKSRRICRLEQELAANGRWALSWKLVDSSQRKPYFIVQFPATANPAAGMHLVIGGFAREFKPQEWACTAAICEIYVPADSTAQQLILGAASIRFRYTTGSDAIEVPGSMNGFTAALNALAGDPTTHTATAAATAAPPKVQERKKVTASRQFESLRKPEDPVPDALKQIYGID